jgi:hypothetical protein
MKTEYLNLPEEKPLTEAEFWDLHCNSGEVVKPLSKPCGDCAIETGFYVEIADMLVKQPEEIREKVAARWYCHNNCNRGCAGLLEYLKANIVQD